MITFPSPITASDRMSAATALAAPTYRDPDKEPITKARPVIVYLHILFASFILYISFFIITIFNKELLTQLFYHIYLLFEKIKV